MGTIDRRCIELRRRPPLETPLSAAAALFAFRAVVSEEPRLQRAARVAKFAVSSPLTR